MVEDEILFDIGHETRQPELPCSFARQSQSQLAGIDRRQRSALTISERKRLRGSETPAVGSEDSEPRGGDRLDGHPRARLQPEGVTTAAFAIETLSIVDQGAEGIEANATPRREPAPGPQFDVEVRSDLGEREVGRDLLRPGSPVDPLEPALCLIDAVVADNHTELDKANPVYWKIESPVGAGEPDFRELVELLGEIARAVSQGVFPARRLEGKAGEVVPQTEVPISSVNGQRRAVVVSFVAHLRQPLVAAGEAPLMRVVAVEEPHASLLEIIESDHTGRRESSRI